MKYIKVCTDRLKSIADILLNSRCFLIAIGFAAGKYFDPIALVSGISMTGWFFAGVLFSLFCYLFYAYRKINQDSFGEF
tara:strand:+ start:680 stop:916 length:237 start_codon:yes stop_codon:yes gene_type:complete